jgi:5'-3' exonuclease
MGILSFSKIFLGREIKFKDLKNLTCAVDASIIAYQSVLGMKNINALTDGDGNPTIHINVVIAKCLNFKKCGINQVWVFDYHEKGYVNPSKIFEIEKRKKVKDTSQVKLKELYEKKKETQRNEDMFSSDEDEDKNEKVESAASIETKIHSQEKVGYSINDKIVNDIKFILDCFNISWCESPKGYEAESICAFLTDDKNQNNAFCDVVWTTDTDAVIYGATQVVRELKVNKKKKLIVYELNVLLENNELSMKDLRKIAVIAGCDHCIKTPGIGPKTILKKFKTIELTNEQKTAVKVFEKSYDISKLKWHNFNDAKELHTFNNTDKITKLLDWIEIKNFNRERIVKQINKVIVH